MKKLFAVSALLALTFSHNSNANLIVNGGFEENTISAGSWKFFSSDKVSGWEGDNIEIWNSHSGVKAPEGNQHIELNAHPFQNSIFSIFQDIQTNIGSLYELSFQYSARQNSNESFYVSISGNQILVDDHIKGSWKTFTNIFTATNTTTRIEFFSSNNSTYGNFIDNVKVTGISTVPESNSALLLLLGMIALFAKRKSDKTRHNFDQKPR